MRGRTICGSIGDLWILGRINWQSIGFWWSLGRNQVSVHLECDDKIAADSNHL